MSGLRDSVLALFESVLTFLHDIFEPVFGVHSWGWAVIALTVLVRVLLLPLAIKQTRSMRAMQAIQPQMKELQNKYKVDRELMRKDPEQYRSRRAKLNEEMMALYRREGANPAASCLPLLAQAPVFIALFWTLRGMDELVGQPFYFVTSVSPGGLEVNVSDAGWPGWLLIVLMSGSMFWMQKQMMARNAGTAASNPMAQQQKILLYVMPIFLAVISFQFPLGILLYWVTTNFWQVGQQSIILREVKHHPTDEQPDTVGHEPPRRSPGASSGKQKGQVPKPDPKPDPKQPDEEEASDTGTSASGESPRTKKNKSGNDSGSTPKTPKKSSDHLPKRRKRDEDG
ncbi:MAG: YidC/Oxa1 family membrane protein insertase [Nitriliruptoraceae bacterium]